MRSLLPYLTIGLVAVFVEVLGPPVCLGQQSDLPLISSVEITGNEHFSDAELHNRIRSQPNREFMDIPGATLWAWLYRVGQNGCCFHTRVAQAFKSMGEPPAHLNSSVLEADIDRLHAFYAQEGFREAEIEPTLEFFDNENRVRIRFHVEAGEPTMIRRVRYEGLDHLAQERKLELARQSTLQPSAVEATHPLQFRTANQRYSERELLSERQRLLTFLRNEGYPRIARDSIRVVVSRPHADSFDVAIHVDPGKRYRFGDVHFTVTGPETAEPRTDTLLTPEGIRNRFRPAPAGDSVRTGWVISTIQGESRLNPSVLTTALRFMPGDWFDQSQVLATKRRLENAGIFAFSDAIPVWLDAQDSIRTDSSAVTHNPTDSVSTAPRIPYRIDLRTRQRHRLRLETFMIQRTAILGPDSRNELGAGLGSTYSNANLFGQAEIFELGITGSIAANWHHHGFLPDAQLETTASITYPYLIGPFNQLDRALDLYDARSTFSLNFLTARREEFTIRGRGEARLRLNLFHREDVASLVDLFDMSLSDPRLSEQLIDTLRNRIADEFVLGRLLNDYNVPQVNNAFRYTLRSMTTPPLRRNQGHLYEGIVEIGGNLPYLMDRYVFSPSLVQGSLPGLPIFQTDGQDTRMIYRRYMRVVADLRNYEPLGPGTVLAWKFLAGVGHPLGQSNLLPFERRFYAGGATSVRGWGLRDLGPGATSTRDIESSFIRSGDIKLESSIELRRRIVEDLLAADWQLAFFTDVGNIWLGPKNPGVPAGRFRFNSFYKQLGVGTGVGIRFVWDYLILRFDMGWKVHSPIPGTPLFPDGFHISRRHFGIGHVF